MRQNNPCNNPWVNFISEFKEEDNNHNHNVKHQQHQPDPASFINNQSQNHNNRNHNVNNQQNQPEVALFHNHNPNEGIDINCNEYGKAPELMKELSNTEIDAWIEQVYKRQTCKPVYIFDEFFNEGALDFILQNKELLQNTIAREYINEPYIWNRLKIYKKLSDEGIIRIPYFASKKHNIIGRVFCKKDIGLQRFPREIRGLLTKDLYVDVDIVNCHPNLLCHLCDCYDIDAQSVINYRDNRDELLTEISNQNLISRTQAKETVISIMNGCKKSYDDLPVPTQFITSLYQEIKEIKTKICPHYKELHQLVKDEHAMYKKNGGKKYKNADSTTLAWIMFELENKILSEMIAFWDTVLTYNAKTIKILLFDGLLMAKQDGLHGYIAQCEAHIMRKLNIPIKLKIKPIQSIEIPLNSIPSPLPITLFMGILEQRRKQSFDLLEWDQLGRSTLLSKLYEEEKRIKLDDNITPRARKKQLFLNKQKINAEINERYKRQKEYVEQYIIHTIKPPLYIFRQNDEVVFWNTTELKNAFTQLQDWFDSWFKDVEQASYFKADYYLYPEICPENCFNLWTGFEIEKKAPKLVMNEAMMEKLKIIHRHISVLCNHDQVCIQYLLYYLSHTFQRPGELAGIGLLFVSKQGVGKDLFFYHFIGAIIGKKYCLQTSTMDHIIGKFNKSANKLLLLLSEARGTDTFTASDHIKARITQEDYVYEEKFKQLITLKNFGRWIFFSNHKCPLKIEYDDRRFVAIQCDSTYANNEEYFARLVPLIHDPMVQKAFYDECMNRNINGFLPRYQRPLTEFYHELRKRNIDRLALFLNSVINNQVMEVQNDTPIKSSTLHKIFLRWCDDTNFKQVNYTHHQFGCDMKKYKGIYKKKSNCVVYRLIFSEIAQFLEDEGIISDIV